jgi:hypothetical protein
MVQNQTTGAYKMLLLDASAHLMSTINGNVALPKIVGEGNFINGTQVGETFVTQLANGELDFIAFNAAGQAIHSDLVANTIGLGKVVGVGESYLNYPTFSGIGTNAVGGNDDVIVQGADGSLTAVGFSGNFNNSTLTEQASFLLPQSAGLPTVGTINPNTGGVGTIGENIIGNNNQETVQMIGQTASGQLEAMYFDSGYGGDAATKGDLLATNLLSPALAGFNIVNAGLVAHIDLFPIS